MTPQEAGISAVEIFDPMSPRVLADPYRAYRALRDHHPVAHLEPLDLWAVSRYADVREVLAEPAAFSAALAFGRDASITDRRSEPRRQLNLRFSGDFGGVVSSTDGVVHARLRRMVAGLLSKPRLDAVERSVGEHVERIAAGLRAAGDGFDLVGDLAGPVAARAIAQVMGLDQEMTEVLLRWVDLTARALDPGDPLSTVEAAPRVMLANLGCVRAVAAFLRTGTRHLPDQPPNGLMEAWRAADGPAGREEVILSVLQLFQAGYETIVSAVCSTLAVFVVDRPLPDPARPEELELLIGEGIRLGSPVRATVRTVVGARQVGGVSVPDGAMLMLLLGSANRDERVFPDPDRPAVGRAPHLAFGGGPHRCLGRYLAHAELSCILRVLTEQVNHLRSAGTARISANILKAGHASLPVQAEWRRP
ncbi:cytochrome P450 [Kitasatospora sp. NBC_01287]|uniref:cytochrome P450 n=1 Tax=Kitasatospora sp. NBC_01287 TaxID=2903573 RepID=UPI002256AE60|nr:cytochrome P450 [Kitasatospora sp. NBC_01287]MCX4745054.1 cytochrome P450 [Kitasatospora sp. NBC_01287]